MPAVKMSKAAEKIEKTFEQTFYSSPWYYGLVEVLQYVIFIIIIYKYNPFNITTNHPAFANLLVLFVSFIYVALFYFLNYRRHHNLTDSDASESSFLINILKTFGTFIVFVFLTIGILWLFKSVSILTALLHYGMLILIIAVMVTILYILVKPFFGNLLDTAKSKPYSLLSFIINLIIFVPCLFEQFIMYIKHEYALTTRPVWLLIALEIIIIALWIVIPILFHKLSTHDGKQLLSEPVYLNEEHTLGNFENLHVDNIKDLKTGKFKYHYSLSAWIYINPQPPNTSSAYTQYTSLLNYGNKPNIEFNGKLNSLRVMAQVGKKSNTANKGDLVEIFETKNMMYQKWNNIVINYDGGTMDVFLNGELVGSRPNIAPYMTYENITSGKKDGIHGGICNVNYYNSIMKKGTIELMYKLLRDKKVPLYV